MVCVSVGACLPGGNLDWLCCRGTYATSPQRRRLNQLSSCDLVNGTCAAQGGGTPSEGNSTNNTPYCSGGVSTACFEVDVTAFSLSLQVHDWSAAGNQYCNPPRRRLLQNTNDGPYCCGPGGSTCGFSGVCQVRLERTQKHLRSCPEHSA